MDESNKGSQPSGSSVNHSRPFFYVQPPMQPFYGYQWHMNNPYSHHGFPGSGFHQFGRPYMVPYSYLQYPGYIMPHASMHPMDYRRGCDRNFPHATSAAYDISLRQYGSAQRETTCAGAQTDPCEALNKLIECLDQLRAGDSCPQQEKYSGKGARGLDTNLPSSEEQKCQEEENGISVGKLHSDSTLAEYDAESTCSHMEHSNQQDDWSSDSGKEPPLDSSSIHEEGTVQQEQQKGKYLNEDSSQRHSVSVQNQFDVSSSSSQEMVYDERITPKLDGGQSIKEEPVHPSAARIIEHDCPEDGNKPPKDVEGEHSCCILHLPIEKVLSAGVLGPGKASPSLGSTFSYSYCPPQLAQERVSVLSPSLDELSSHDELLSTDLEDVDLYPTCIYTRGKLGEVASRRSHLSVSDVCLVYPKRLACAVCGSHTFKELSRPKGYYCESQCCKDVDKSDPEIVFGGGGGGSETEKTCERCLRGLPARVLGHRKLVKHKVKLAPHRDKLEEQGKLGQLDGPEHTHCDKCMSSSDKSCHAARGGNSRPCKERRCRTVGLKLDQIPRESVGGNDKPKGCRPQPLPQRQERQRKARFNPQVPSGSRNDDHIVGSDGGGNADDNEDAEEDSCEMLQFHRGKGTTKRGGPRC